MRAVFNKLKKIEISTAVKIFDMKIKPMILYGSEIWDVKFIDQIENIQIKYFKAFLGVGKSTVNAIILPEVNRYHLFVDYYYRAVKYWCRLMEADGNRYTRKSYNQMYKLCQEGKQNWASGIKHLLEKHGFGEVWMLQQVGDVKYFLSTFKQRLRDVSYQMRNSELHALSSIYDGLTEGNELPAYITFNFEIADRRLITLLRTSSLPVKNNLFRWKIAENNICSRCTLNVIDDECHFIFECPYYNIIRSNFPFITKCVNGTSDLKDAFLQLLMCNNKQYTIEVLQYIKKAKICLSDT